LGPGVEEFTPYVKVPRNPGGYVTFSYTLDKFLPEGRYSVTAFVSTGVGDFKDDDNAKFFTASGTGVYKPVVANAIAWEESHNQWKMQGSLGYTNGEECDVGIEIRNPDDSIFWNCTSTKPDSGLFGFSISGFQPDTTYKWRAFAANSQGWSHANHWNTFHTAKTSGEMYTKPKVKTLHHSVEKVLGITWITLSGNILDSGYLGTKDSANRYCDVEFYIECEDSSYWEVSQATWPLGGQVATDNGETIFWLTIPKFYLAPHGNHWSYYASALNAGGEFDNGESKDFYLDDLDNDPPIIIQITKYPQSNYNVQFDGLFLVQDQDESGDSINEYYWEFGDGKYSKRTSKTAQITHHYPGPGTYRPTLYVIDDEGSRCIRQEEITLEATCFLAGTNVLMADGSHKNIEDVKIGEMVKAFDDKSGQMVSSKVTKVFHNPAEKMIYDYYLIINDDLKVTPNHLVYSNGNWVAAGDLKLGDSLFDSKQHMSCEVQSIEKIYEKQPIYDLTIEKHHNYFVSINGFDILVHNHYDEPIPDGIYYREDLKIERVDGKTGLYDVNSTIEFPLKGTICIYLYHSSSLIGKIWILDSDYLTYEVPTSTGTKEVTMSNGGVYYSDSNKIKRAPKFYESDGSLALRVVQTVVNNSFNAGGESGYSVMIDGNLYASRIREVNDVYNLTLQLSGDNNKLWLNHYQREYPNFKENDDKITLYYSPSYDGTKLALSLFTLDLDIK